MVSQALTLPSPITTILSPSSGARWGGVQGRAESICLGSELIYIMRLIRMNNSSGAWGCMGEDVEMAGLPTLKTRSL